MYKFLNELPNLHKLYEDIKGIAKPYERFSKEAVRDFLFFYSITEKDFSKVKYQLTEYEKNSEYFREFTNNFLDVPSLDVLNALALYDQIPIEVIEKTATFLRVEYFIVSAGTIFYLLKDHVNIFDMPNEIILVRNLLNDTPISRLGLYIRYNESYVDIIKDILYIHGFKFNEPGEPYIISNKAELVEVLKDALKDFLDTNFRFDSENKISLSRIVYKEDSTHVPF